MSPACLLESSSSSSVSSGPNLMYTRSAALASRLHHQQQRTTHRPEAEALHSTRGGGGCVSLGCEPEADKGSLGPTDAEGSLNSNRGGHERRVHDIVYGVEGRWSRKCLSLWWPTSAVDSLGGLCSCAVAPWLASSWARVAFCCPRGGVPPAGAYEGRQCSLGSEELMEGCPSLQGCFLY